MKKQRKIRKVEKKILKNKRKKRGKVRKKNVLCVRNSISLASFRQCYKIIIITINKDYINTTKNKQWNGDGS